MWTEVPKGKNKKPVNKDRFISKMFLRSVPRAHFDTYLTPIYRGDSVILGDLPLTFSRLTLSDHSTVLRNTA